MHNIYYKLRLKKSFLSYVFISYDSLNSIGLPSIMFYYTSFDGNSFYEAKSFTMFTYQKYPIFDILSHVKNCVDWRSKDTQS